MDAKINQQRAMKKTTTKQVKSVLQLFADWINSHREEECEVVYSKDAFVVRRLALPVTQGKKTK